MFWIGILKLPSFGIGFRSFGLGLRGVRGIEDRIVRGKGFGAGI